MAALVSTVLLFALLLGGAWLGGVVYEALPYGPFPKSRLVSSGVTVLVLLAGYAGYSRVLAPRIGGRIRAGMRPGQGTPGSGRRGRGGGSTASGAHPTRGSRKAPKRRG